MSAVRVEGISLRQAALIAGFAYLLNPVSYAEFSIFPKLVIPGNVEQTVANISAHHGLFLAAFFCYFINFIEDVVIAWALYILLAPVNRALSLLASWLQLVYAAIALAASFNLPIVYRMLTMPEYAASFGSAQLHAQVNLLLHTFRYDYSMDLVIFALHLILVGYLIVRSRYIPWWLGAILIVDGVGWVITVLKPYLYPNADVGWVFFTSLGELVFMLWLLIMGWNLQEPELTVTPAA